MTQKELAAKVGTSTWTVQAVELGKLKLSQSLAFRISQATGADYGWLLENDLTKPPINQQKKPYSDKDLALAQDATVKENRISRLNGKVELTQAYYYLRLVWEEVVKDPEQLSFFLYRLKHFVDRELDTVPKVQEQHRIPQELLTDIDSATDSSPPRAVRRAFSSLFPVDARSFEVMEADAYEGRKAFEQHSSWMDGVIAEIESKKSPKKELADREQPKPAKRSQRASK